MKLILAGHEKSKAILPASSHLVKKYLKDIFDVYWLNYGDYTGKLFAGQYVKLDEKQEGGGNSWARYIREYLKTLDDELIVFALDDYLISDEIDEVTYDRLLGRITIDDNVVCARLCVSDFYRHYEELHYDMIRLTSNNEYSATTQYCIWKRDFLIWLLGKVTSAWDFEMVGSVHLNGSGKDVIAMLKYPAIKYPDASSMSSKWSGIKVGGNKREDIDEMVKEGLLDKGCLIHG